MKLGHWGKLAGLVVWAVLARPVLAADRVALPGAVPAAVARLTPIGPLPATNELHLAIGLALRNRAALDARLQQIYDPASTNFHHYLSPEEFTAEFGPTEEDYQKVIEFAKSHGLVVTQRYANRQLVDVSGKVADIDKAFQIALNEYQHPTEHRVFFAPDVAPTVEAGVPILSVSGLNNYTLPHPAGHAQLN